MSTYPQCRFNTEVKIQCYQSVYIPTLTYPRELMDTSNRNEVPPKGGWAPTPHQKEAVKVV